MALSSDLVSQFIKTTNDKPKASKEETVYGTVVEGGVKLDGSEMVTPMTTYANMQLGDRVRVSIKNHTAYVVGNATSPAARIQDVDDVNTKVDENTNNIKQVNNDITQINNVITEQGNNIELINNDLLAKGNTINLINNTLTAHNSRIETVESTIETHNSSIETINSTISTQGSKIDAIDSTVKTQASTIETINSAISTQGSKIDTIDSTVKTQGSSIETLNSSVNILNSSFQIQNGVVTGIKGIDTEWITTEQLEADSAKIIYLTGEVADFKTVTTDLLDAHTASIDDLYANKLSTTDADIKYANIDFSNIGKAAMEYFYANSGLIKNVVVGDQTLTGELVGVTIKGDLIEGNTIVADKLVIKGEDGLYYKLNTDGITTEAEQTDYNSLNGQVIRARSITATKIAVEDLVAFGATIGGFKITDNSIYSGVKESVNNGTRGIYLDNTGQIAFGDGHSYIKYYKDTDGTYKLAISAEQITMGGSSTNISDEISAAQAAAEAAIVSTIEQFYHSDSPTELSGGEWSIVEPIWQDGKYVWRRNKVTYGSGRIDYTPSENGVCISGNTGAKGEDSTLLRIESSRGTVFKNDQVSTLLSVVIYHGSQRITDSTTMKSVFGNGAYIQWKWQRLDDETFGVISADDARFGNDGFTFTLSPEDVDTKITFMCELIT